MTPGPLVAVGIAAIIIALLTPWRVRVLERRRREDERASDVQQRIAAPLSRGPRLAAAAILPAATWADDGAPTVVITGTVGSEEARGRVLEIARRVAPTATIVDPLELAPPDPRITD